MHAISSRDVKTEKTEQSLYRENQHLEEASATYYQRLYGGNQRLGNTWFLCGEAIVRYYQRFYPSL